MDDKIEAVTVCVLYKNVFLTISQNSHENTCLIKLQAYGLNLY